MQIKIVLPYLLRFDWLVFIVFSQYTVILVFPRNWVRLSNQIKSTPEEKFGSSVDIYFCNV